MQKIKESPSTPTVTCNISLEGHKELEKLFGCRKYREAHTALVRRCVGRVAAMSEGHTTILNLTNLFIILVHSDEEVLTKNNIKSKQM